LGSQQLRPAGRRHRDAPSARHRISNPSGSQYVAVAAGAEHTCALASNGDVHLLGREQLRPAERRPGWRRKPLVLGPRDLDADAGRLASNVRTISAGDRHNCALRGQRHRDCWGEKEHAATRPQQPSPTSRRSPPAAVSVARSMPAGRSIAGAATSISSSEQGVSWDGVNPTVMTTATPMAVSNVVSIATGPRTTCVTTRAANSVLGRKFRRRGGQRAVAR